MHEGCAGNFNNGKEVVNKLRMMGFSSHNMPMAFEIKCSDCGNIFTMTTFETKCPECGMVFGVTPCHAFDPENVQAAGINY